MKKPHSLGLGWEYHACLSKAHTLLGGLLTQCLHEHRDKFLAARTSTAPPQHCFLYWSQLTAACLIFLIHSKGQGRELFWPQSPWVKQGSDCTSPLRCRLLMGDCFQGHPGAHSGLGEAFRAQHKTEVSSRWAHTHGSML